MTTKDTLCDVLGCPGKRIGWLQVRVQDTAGTFHEYSLSVCEWHDQFLRAATELSRTGADVSGLDDLD
jgi:hypothetical protein